MPTTRISEPTREALRKLAYRRHRFLEESNRAFDALKASEQAWKSEQAEREAWNVTLANGLKDE